MMKKIILNAGYTLIALGVITLIGLLTTAIESL